jgi:hypothetical protein
MTPGGGLVLLPTFAHVKFPDEESPLTELAGYVSPAPLPEESSQSRMKFVMGINIG